MKKIFFALTLFALLLPAVPRANGAEISVDFFYNNMPGGSWIDVEDYGYGWQPEVAVSDSDWRPYADGYWAYTDYGWTWISYEDFGWATYHYGLKKILPEARVDHRWSGQVICSPDGLPYIGENAERQFIATGYCGNGITFGTVSAIMARDWAMGTKNPWRDLFAADRQKIKGAAWNYIKENKDYPYYMIKDRLARPEGDSAREIRRGEGMIIGSR